MTSNGPCATWPIVFSCDAAVAAASPTQEQVAKDSATFVLWALSGRRYGACTVTIRPCRRDLVPTGWHEWGSGYRPVLYNGEWSNTCGHQVSCSCTSVSEIRLPFGPVSQGDIVSVKIDGATIPANGYRIDNYGTLVRLGGDEWPACQDLLLADTAVGTWSVTYEYGEDVDAMGLVAAGELACEFLKAIVSGSGACRLPQRVQSLSRQGVSVTLLDPQDFLADGRTGLPLADLWLASVNPGSLSSRPVVLNADTYRNGPRIVGSV